MKVIVCALPECDVPMLPGRLPFRLGGHNEEYCSRGCVNIAFELMRKNKKYAKAQPKVIDYIKQDEREELAAARASPAQEETVKVKAEQFGGAEVYRRYCDNLACKGPITVLWKGRRGEYCSNNCLKTEKEKTNMTNETNESPIAAGAPTLKKESTKAKAAPKAAVKATAKAAVKATAKAAPKTVSDARANFPKDGTIKIVKKTELAAHGRRGKAGEAFDALKDGITVEKFRDAVKKKNTKNGDWYAGFTLKFATAEGWITIK